MLLHSLPWVVSAVPSELPFAVREHHEQSHLEKEKFYFILQLVEPGGRN